MIFGKLEWIILMHGQYYDEVGNMFVSYRYHSYIVILKFFS